MDEDSGWERFEGKYSKSSEDFVRIMPEHDRLYMNKTLYNEAFDSESFVDFYIGVEESEGKIGIKPKDECGENSFNLYNYENTLPVITCRSLIYFEDLKGGKYPAEWNEDEGMIVVDVSEGARME